MIIDIHSHYLPRDAASADGPVQLTESSDHVLITALDHRYRAPVELLDPESQFRTDYGDALQGRTLLLPPFALLYELDSDAGTAWSRRLNESVATAAARDPRRLFGFGTVPLQAGGDAAAAELDHAVNALGLRGVEILTTVAGRSLVESDLDAFWAAAERLRVPVFIHPHYLAAAEQLTGFHLRNVIGNPVETGTAAVQLMLSPVLTRYPNLTIILAHGGGILPGIFGRLVHAASVRPEYAGHDSAAVKSLLRRFCYDTVVFDPRTLSHLSSLVGPDRILTGTDFPFDMAERHPRLLLDDADVSAAERQSILQGAQRLLFEG